MALSFALVASIALGAMPVVRAADVLEIPAVLPITGGAAFLGKAESNALKAAEETINRAGGIKGRPVRFAIYDDQTNPQVAVQLMTAALAKKPSIVFDGGPATTCRATMALISNGPLMYCFTPSIVPTAGSYVFSSMFSSDTILQTSVKYLRERGIKKIGVLNGTDATGQDADRVLTEYVKEPENIRAGVQFVAYEHYNLSDLSVVAQLTRIKAAGAQALIAFTTGTATATVLHGVQDIGLDIPVVSSPGNMNYAQLKTYKGLAPKELLFAGTPVFVPDQVNDAGVRRAIDTFAKALERVDGGKPDLLNSVAWDPMVLLNGLLDRFGPDATPQQLKGGLDAMRNVPGVFGRYDFKATPQRGINQTWAIMERWDPNKEAFIAVSKPGGALL